MLQILKCKFDCRILILFMLQERAGGGGLSLIEEFSLFLGWQKQNEADDDRPVTGQYDLSHLIQRILHKVFESRTTGDQSIQLLLMKVFALMDNFSIGKRRAQWQEFNQREGYETLTFMSRIQQQRFVAGHLRGINTYLRNLVPLLHFKGQDE